jgi:hypothetical protein
VSVARGDLPRSAFAPKFAAVVVRHSTGLRELHAADARPRDALTWPGQFDVRKQKRWVLGRWARGTGDRVTLPRAQRAASGREPVGAFSYGPWRRAHDPCGEVGVVCPLAFLTTLAAAWSALFRDRSAPSRATSSLTSGSPWDSLRFSSISVAKETSRCDRLSGLIRRCHRGAPSDTRHSDWLSGSTVRAWPESRSVPRSRSPK